MSQSQRNHKCPFFAGPMIQDERFFIGREDELKIIYDSMTGLQPISISLVGEHRIGKSSLLYHFYQKYKNEDKYCVIFLDVQEAECHTENSLYKAIADEFKNSPSAVNNRNFNNVWQNKTWDKITFNEAVKACKDDRNIAILPVLLIDKFDAVFQYPQEFTNGFYDNLHSLMNHSYMMIVAATLEPLNIYREKHNLTSSFFNVGQILGLKDFSDEEVEQLLNLPEIDSSDGKPALNSDSQQIAKEWGGKKPYRLQLAAKYLWEGQKYNKSREWAEEKFKEQLDAQPKPKPKPTPESIPEATSKPNTTPKQLKDLGLDSIKGIGKIPKKIGKTISGLAEIALGIFLVFLFILFVSGHISQAQFKQQLNQIFCRTIGSNVGICK